MLMAPMAMTLLMGLAGCVQVGGDVGPEWDGQLVVQGGYDRDYHAEAFHAERGRQHVDVGSARGRASMGAPAGGGGHAPSGGGGHAPSGGGHK
jgi:hypothetical protein